MQYTNFRIHKDTHKELRKIRTKLKADSMDNVIKFLIQIFKEETTYLE